MKDLSVGYGRCRDRSMDIPLFVSSQSVVLRRQGSLTFTLYPKGRDGSELGRCRMQIPFEHSARMLREQLSVFKLFCRRSSIHLEWTC